MSTTEDAKAPTTKRVRRSAEEARRLILEAAERRLETQGPDGIRLQDIARDVGISHPAILHHFESREGLVRALVAHISEQLRGKLLAALEASDGGTADANELIGNLFETLSDRGSARLLAWLLMSEESLSGTTTTNLLKEFVDRIHDQRCTAARERGVPAPDREDTEFIALLASNAAFGDAFVGRMYRTNVGADDGAAHRFRTWLARLLSGHAGRLTDDG